MSDQQEDVVYNGVQISMEWKRRIEEAQNELTHIIINGEPAERVRYGNEPEDWGADRQPCRDCEVIKGQYHVPGCELERCPICDGQAIGCDCDYTY